MKSSMRFFLQSAAIMGIVLSGIAHAQTEKAASVADGDAGGVADIVVTAQKRSEKLQNVAAAASALTADMLVNKAVTKLEDLQTATPGLSITNSGLTQNVNIRGIGLASGSPSAANGVATYFDGIFQPPIVTTNSFYDLGSVEIFRGPQGTFVGSNSTGGAIFINSQNPKLNEYGGYFEGTTGSYSRVGAQGAINVPVGSTFAIRAAGVYNYRHSYYTDIGDAGSQAGMLREYGGRIGAYWEPSDNFSALLKVEMARKNTGGYAYAPIPDTRYAPFRQPDIFTLDYSDDTRNLEKAFQTSLKLDYETDGGIIFRSVSGYQNKRISNFYDMDATSATTLPRTTQDQFVRERVWTQEFNILSPTDTAFAWILGGYFQRNRIDVDITNQTVGAPVRVDIDIANKKTTTGLFGQVTYKFSPQFSIDMGARYSRYKVTGVGGVTLQPANIYLADPGGDHKDGRMTGKVSLNWTPDQNNLVYGFIARGYKSGGFASPTVSFKPETVIDYELGWKSTMLDGHLRTQLSGFYYDYKNFQLDAIEQSTGRSGIINLTSAKVKGIEAQAQAKFGGFQFDGSLAYVHSRLAGTQFIDIRSVALAYPGVNNAPQCPTGQASNPPTCLDYTPFIGTTSGGPNLYSPEWTYNLGAQYAFPAGSATVTPRVNYAYVGPQWTYIGYDPVRDRIEGRGLLSAMLTVDFDRITVAAFGTNLTNKKYVTGQTSTNEFYGAPREYGVRLHVTF